MTGWAAGNVRFVLLVLSLRPEEVDRLEHRGIRGAGAGDVVGVVPAMLILGGLGGRARHFLCVDA